MIKSVVPRHSFNMTIYDKKSFICGLCSKNFNMTIYGDFKFYEQQCIYSKIVILRIYEGTAYLQYFMSKIFIL